MKCGGTVRMLVDLELLAHADYLVASEHSAWARLLQYMRYVLYGGGLCTVHAAFVTCFDTPWACLVRFLL